jgi:hypothetical protein
VHDAKTGRLFFSSKFFFSSECATVPVVSS